MPAGELEINGQDAYTTWGVGLEDGSLSELMAFPSFKEWITNESRLENGVRYAQPTAKVAARELTLVFHLMSRSKEDYLQKHTSFYSQVLSQGVLNIRTKRQMTTIYKCKYISCTQFAQYHDNGGGLAKFSVKLVEPNPGDRLCENVPIGQLT